MDIMNMKSGVLIKNKRNGSTYILGEYVNEVARELKLLGSIGNFAIDYINTNTQEEYEIVD